jgi:NitT/TauT family transport system substrate-binding protein
MTQNRRDFIHGMSVAGAAALAGLRPGSAEAEPPPETLRIRLGGSPGICFAPQYVVEPLLKAEGFTDVEYVKFTSVPERTKDRAAGRIDMTMDLATPLIMRIDAGDPILVLSGIHVGCYELFGNERVRTIRDLKGRKVGVDGLGSSEHVFLSSMVAYIGLDPRKDIRWVSHPSAERMRLFAEGEIDALLGFPPEPQELRARKVGHVVVNTAVDQPWSHHFCCMLSANRAFVEKHPVATKRALRAFVKAADLCGQEPDRVARSLVDQGRTPRYDYAAQALREIPYTGQWREYDPESTLRFLALRLREIGFVKSAPPKLIAQGTDWRMLNELKKELKG